MRHSLYQCEHPVGRYERHLEEAGKNRLALKEVKKIRRGNPFVEKNREQELAKALELVEKKIHKDEKNAAVTLEVIRVMKDGKEAAGGKRSAMKSGDKAIDKKTKVQEKTEGELGKTEVVEVDASWVKVDASVVDDVDDWVLLEDA